ncbi:hypothetical protein ACIQOF_11675 [Streptomyces sp. NPDC091265]|uniref:hypothetical protein n=1 Tax=unclassified Streptomyces TaxID=2593676 RepID=UPI00344B3A32
MTIARTFALGAVSALSFAAIVVGAAPAGASPAEATAAVAPNGVAAKGICSGWKNAGGIPFKWKTINDGCAHFGAKGMKMAYGWKVYKGGSVCVKVKGFNAKGKKTWYKAGCGRNGSVKAPWGNNAAEKEMQIKGAALLRWN